MAVNKICPNYIFKIIFDNEKELFLITLVTFCKKENINKSACVLSLILV